MKSGLGLHLESLAAAVLRCAAAANSSRLGCEKCFHVGNCVGDAIGREGLEEDLAVALARDARVEEDEDAAIFKGADKPAETLL